MPLKRRGSNRAGSEKGAAKYAQLLKEVFQIRVDGRPVYELFAEIPDAQVYPDYRDVVDVPISLAEISKRVRVDAYETDDSVIADFELMAENARLYNGDDSPVFDDAVDILDFVLLFLGRQLSNISRLRLQLQILGELEGYKYKGRRLSDAFMTEPSAKEYPNYRTIVKEPTSFSKVRKQLTEEGPAPSWDAFRTKVDLIFANALQYNVEGSQIALDALTLRKQLDSRIKRHSTLPRHLHTALGSASNSARSSVKPESDDEISSKRSKTGSQRKNGRGIDDSDDDQSSSDEDDDQSSNSDMNSDNDAPPVYDAPKYEDDDDEDFEADSDDMDEEDMPSDNDNEKQMDGNDANRPGEHDGMNSQFNQPSVVYDEIVYRLPNETAENAMISLVTCHSTPVSPHLAMNLPIEDVKRAENDMLQLRILPSPTKAFTSFATTLPYYQSTLRLSVHANPTIQPLQLVVLFNGAKLMPISSTGGINTIVPPMNPAQGNNMNTVNTNMGNNMGNSIGPNNMGTGPDMGPNMGPGMGPGMSPSMSPSMGPSMGPIGPNMGPNMGPNGPNGPNGLNGPNGFNGLNGPNGPNGLSMGPNGPSMGPNGPNIGSNTGPNMGPNIGPNGSVPSGPNMGPNMGPNSSAVQNSTSDSDSQSPVPSGSDRVDSFEISLSPGLNQVTVIAIKSTYGGYMRQYGPPPLADAEEDEERMVLFLNLSK